MSFLGTPVDVDVDMPEFGLVGGNGVFHVVHV